MTDDQPIPFSDQLDIEPLTQEQIEQRAPDWYEKWRVRIHEWVSRHTDAEAASVFLFVPDLLALIVRLARDRRVPFILKGQLLLAAAYVLSPVDLMPEGLLGVIGLSDDAGLMVLVLMWIKGVASIDRQVLRENWSGHGDVIEVIDNLHQRINANTDRIYSKDLWQSLQRRFGEIRQFFSRGRGQKAPQ